MLFGLNNSVDVRFSSVNKKREKEKLLLWITNIKYGDGTVYTFIVDYTLQLF